ncbi:MAG: FecR family protein [Prevotella sp.]
MNETNHTDFEIKEAIFRNSAPAPDIDKAWEQFRQKTCDANESRELISINHRPKVIMALLAVAASLLLLFVAYPYLNNKDGNKQIASETESKTIVIEANAEPQSVTVRDENGKQTTLAKDRYLATNKGSKLTTVSTSRGKECNLLLADGTKVWLNAESSLTFPESFNGTVREVSLKGEAFFEVVHDTSHPFIVKSEYLTTRVLGTVFDVRAYSRKDASVTLVDGSVEVKPSDIPDSSPVVITPGQQAFIAGGVVKTQETDTYPLMQRKSGLFYFHESPMLHIMGEIGRWYNRTVVFENPSVMTTRLHFVAERKDSLNNIIRCLNELDNVDIEIEADGSIVVK